MNRLIAVVVVSLTSLAACSQPHNPTAASPIAASGVLSMSAGGAEHSSTSAVVDVVPPRTVTFQPGALVGMITGHPQDTMLPLDGRSVALTATTPEGGELAGPPSLAPPVVDQERRTVVISWARGFGGDPLFWKLYYTTPTGATGFFDIPASHTSFGGTLPFEGVYTVRICAYNGGDLLDGCMWSATQSFRLSPISAVPGVPTAVAGFAVGSRLTLQWGMPASGGPPTTFVILWNGNEYVVGLVSSASADGVPPGRYLLVVYARNAAGNGPPATTEVTVGTTASETYRGTFNSTTTITRTFDNAVCRWQATYSGSATVELTRPASGLTASIRVAGTVSAPRGSSSSPNFECLAGQQTFDSTSPAIVSGTNIARSNIPMAHSTGVFSGNLGPASIGGTLRVSYNNGQGEVTIPMTLSR